MILIAYAVINTKIVQVVDGKNSRYVYTLRTQPAQVLKQIGITLTPQDEIEASGFKSNFAKIDLYQAFPVSITADSATKNILLARGTVADALQKAGVSVGGDDLVSQPLDMTVVPGTNITVRRVTYQTAVKDDPIPYDTSRRTTTLLRKNVQNVLVPGQNGVLETTTRQKFIDGALADENIVAQTVVAQPVTCQLLLGTAANTPVSKLEPPSGLLNLSSSGTPENYVRVIHGVATGYSPKDGKTTATGVSTRVGYVAVNPNKIPYGSRLYIMSPDGSFVYGYAVAQDTGGFATNGSGVDVDLFFSTSEETNLLGKRKVDIYVLS